MSSLSKDDFEKPIGINEASDFLDRKVPTLYKDVQAGYIPHYKKGGKLYFFKSELFGWVKSGKVSMPSEIIKELDDSLSKK